MGIWSVWIRTPGLADFEIMDDNGVVVHTDQFPVDNLSDALKQAKARHSAWLKESK